MYGKKVKLRILFISLLLVSVILSIFLILKSLEENVVYFLSPTEIRNLVKIENKKLISFNGLDFSGNNFDSVLKSVKTDKTGSDKKNDDKK